MRLLYAITAGVVAWFITQAFALSWLTRALVV